MTPLLVTLIAALTVTACERSSTPEARCGRPAVPAAAAPTTKGFDRVSNQLIEPEGCGAAFRRVLVYQPQDAKSEDLMATFAHAMTEIGWVAKPCVTPRERCFQRGRYFFASTTPDAIDDPAVPRGYPRGTSTAPQVLAVISFSAS